MDSSNNDTKSENAEEELRDYHGRFAPKPAESTSSNPTPRDPVYKFFSDHTHYSKSQDDLLDVHIGNPLTKIVTLLEEIKKQKAFSFTLKGSLGIAGVALTLSVFGIFGGGKILCDRGVQSQIGTVMQLQYQETDPSTIPVLSQFLDFFAPKTPHARNVLVKNNQDIIHLISGRNADVKDFISSKVVVTGNYDSCSQTLTVRDPNSIEVFSK